MMIFIITLLSIEIKIKPHIKTSINPTCYIINSSYYCMSDCHGNCFIVLDRAHFAVFYLLLGNHLQYGVYFSEHL